MASPRYRGRDSRHDARHVEYNVINIKKKNIDGLLSCCMGALIILIAVVSFIAIIYVCPTFWSDFRTWVVNIFGRI